MNRTRLMDYQQIYNMSYTSSYADKLKNPKWQKKRLGVLERAGWKCQGCGDGESTLQVHHLKYSGEPWDAPDEWLECLCETCHTNREKFNEAYGKSLIPTQVCLTFYFAFLPMFDGRVEHAPYDPNLNLIPQLWERVRKFRKEQRELQAADATL